MRDIAHITNVENSTLSRIGKCLRNNDDVTLAICCAPPRTRKSASTVLTSEEEVMLTERFIYAGKRGFAVGKDTLKSFDVTDRFRRTTHLERPVPSEDSVREFRARHREITFKNAEKFIIQIKNFGMRLYKAF